MSINSLHKYIVSVAILLAFASCDHKELLEECRTNLKVNVVFDWSNAPTANPQSMALYLFPKDGGDPLRYSFDNNRGGYITVPFGEYTALCVNNDNTDWAELEDTGSIETFRVHSGTVSDITLDNLRTGSAEESADTALVETPQLLWSDAGEHFTILPTDTGVKTLTLYPVESGCHYTIDIYDVENGQSLAGQTMFTTFSGLADGYHPGLSHPSNDNVSMPLVMTVSNDGTQIHGEFLNFGECPDIIYKNELTLHTFLADGSAWAYRFDVTDQAHNASDPRNVHIVLRGLPLPEPIINGGGLKPVVDDWLVERIDLEMPR